MIGSITGGIVGTSVAGNRWFRFFVSLLAALVLQLMQLPDGLAPWRPLWLALILAYWVLASPELPTLAAAFLTGLLSDLMFMSLPGEHALALVLLVCMLQRLRSNLILLPLWQATLVMSGGWAAYTFLLFWLDGLSHHPVSALLRWMPVAVTVLAWPFVVMLMDATQPRRRRHPV